MNIKRLLFRTLLLGIVLFETLTLASCRKGEDETYTGNTIPSGTTIRLDLSGNIEGDLRSGDVSIDLSPSGSISPSIGGAKTLSGWVFITDNAGKTTSHPVTWEVVGGNKLETKPGSVAITFGNTRPAPFKVRVIAGDIPQVHNPWFADTYTAWIIDGKKISINIPFYAETTMTYSSSTSYSLRGLAFKPIGFFVRCQIANETNVPVKVKDLMVYNQGFLKANGEIQHRGTEPLLARPIKTSNGTKTFISIPAKQRSSESVLIWIAGYRYANVAPVGDSRLDICARLEDKHYPCPIYSEIMLRNASTHRYASGKVYKTTIYLREMPNPLSRLSEYPVHKTGTKFMTNWDDYTTITDPDRVGDFEVGFFGHTESKALNIDGYSGTMTPEQYISIFPMSGGAGPTGSIVYFANPADYITEYPTPFAVGSLRKQGLYSIWNEPVKAGAGRDTPRSCYRLILMSAPLNSASASIAPGGNETTEHLRFAYRYTWNKSGYPPSSMVIESRYVGHNESITTAQDIARIDDAKSPSYDPSFWNTAVRRVFPAYGAPGARESGTERGTIKYTPSLMGYKEQVYIIPPKPDVYASFSGATQFMSNELSERGLLNFGRYTAKSVVYLYKHSMD